MLFWAFLLLAAAASLLICILVGYSGFAFAGFFLLFTLCCFLGIFFLYVLFLWVLSLFIRKDKTETEEIPFYRFLLVETIGLILTVFRVQLHTEGLELLPSGTFQLVGNHRSGFDPLLSIWALRRRRLNYVSKPSNFLIPIAGALMRKCGFLSIDRDDDRKALRTILAAADRMQRGVYCFGIYPEGTRSRTGELLPFRNGCFKAAQRAGVPIVVMATKGAEKIMKNVPWRPTQVQLKVCGVLDAETVKHAKTAEISETVREMLLQALQE